MIVQANPRGFTKIGRLGENDYRVIRFPCQAIYNEIPDATVTVMHQRPGDPSAYPVNPAYVNVTDGFVFWTVTSADVSKQGRGQAQLVFISGGKVAKDIYYPTEIGPALDGSGDPPDPWEGWVESVVKAAQDAEAWADETINGEPITDPTASQYHNSAKYHAQQAAGSAQTAESAKTAIQDMTVSATTLTPDQNASAIKTVDQQTGAVNIAYGIPKGTTFTPVVSQTGVLSFTNDGNKVNPQSVDIAGAVRGVFDEVVSGTDPVIVGVANHRYLCGEVYTISITPPASGIIDVIFTSGTTAAVLTLPNTVKMPDWFDATSLDTSKIYEICITDGVYGAVMTWGS